MGAVIERAGIRREPSVPEAIVIRVDALKLALLDADAGPGDGGEDLAPLSVAHAREAEPGGDAEPPLAVVEGGLELVVWRL